MRCSERRAWAHALAPWVLACALALPSGPGARAEHLGAVGPVYPIREQDLLARIRTKLEARQASGEIDRRNREAAARVRARLEHPEPIEGIGAVALRRTFHVDPTYVAPENITDQVGRILVAAGTRVNPLDTVSLSKRFFFIDARDPRQVAQAKALLDRDGRARLKAVLVAGSYLELMRAWKGPVYFDQFGDLTRRLNIVRVPALVGQEGRQLRIEEIPPARHRHESHPALHGVARLPRARFPRCGANDRRGNPRQPPPPKRHP